jgi:hypothetical protein
LITKPSGAAFDLSNLLHWGRSLLAKGGVEIRVLEGRFRASLIDGGPAVQENELSTLPIFTACQKT